MWVMLKPGILASGPVSLDDALYLLELSIAIAATVERETSDVLLSLIAAMDICCGDDDT